MHAHRGRLEVLTILISLPYTQAAKRAKYDVKAAIACVDKNAENARKKSIKTHTEKNIAEYIVQRSRRDEPIRCNENNQPNIAAL